MPRTTTSSRNLPVLAIGGGIVALLAVIAIVIGVTGGDDDDGGSDGGVNLQETAAVEVTGTALPRLADPSADPAVGERAPTVTGVSFDGSPVTIAPNGEAQVIVFVAHWCPHCQAEVPVITQWLADNGQPEGVELRAVSTGVNAAAPNYPPSAWLEGEGWPIPTLVDEPDSVAANTFGLSAFPFFVAVNDQGEVVARISGELTIAQLEALVAAAREG
jgi:thiol-disulfide isomerase/thioredoxin